MHEYGLDEVVRPLTTAERERVAEDHARFDGLRRDRASRVGRELLLPVLVALGVAIAAAFDGAWGITVGGVTFGGILGSVAFEARRRALRAVAADPGLLAEPDGGWRARETTVRARRVVGAASGDEDYERYYLYEVPGQDWFGLVPGEVEALLPDPARATLRLVHLVPRGVLLSATAHGPALPTTGLTSADGDAYAAAVARGEVWAPTEEEWVGDADLRVPERRLPAWILAER